MRLITYISPRVAIWRAFCPPLYTAYNNSHSRKELCTRISAVPSSFSLRGSSPSSPTPSRSPVCPALSLAVSSALFRSSALLSSLCAVPRVSERVLSPSPSDVPLPASCAAAVNHSACDCVRLITVIRPLRGSGISTANYNHRFSSRTSLPRFRPPHRGHHATERARIPSCSLFPSPPPSP